MSVILIGLDTAKSVFQIHGVNETGKAEIKRKLGRSDLLPFFEKQPACTVVMEACGVGHHWARMLTSLGHTARALLIRQRVMLGNALRGLAAEFGLTVPKGVERLAELAALVDTDGSFPADARHAIVALRRHYKDLVDGIDAFEIKIVAHARRDEMARRLATIPGIGPITASLIAASMVDIGLFKTARQFAAWLGLVPRQSSTGGKTRLGPITKAGNREIRTLLVLGATSMVYRAAGWNSAIGAWLRKILERRPVRLATVALANKMARIAWALMTRDEVYHPKGAITRVANATG